MLVQLRSWLGRAVRGSEQLARLLEGEPVLAHDASAGVSVTFVHLDAGLAYLDCAAVRVAVWALRPEEVAGLDEAGHAVHADVVVHLADLVDGPVDHEVIVLRNVLIAAVADDGR